MNYLPADLRSNYNRACCGCLPNIVTGIGCDPVSRSAPCGPPFFLLPGKPRASPAGTSAA